jgi:predicted nucleic acid-binding protein
LIVPAQVTAEVDYLLAQRLGRTSRVAFVRDLAEGRFQVACLEPSDYTAIQAYDDQYADLDVGLTDLAVVVLAHRFRTSRLLTFDQRHFRALRPLDGGSFTLLPYDTGDPS